MRHKGTVTIVTKRLLLRRFAREDVRHVFENWANDAEVTEFLRWQPHGDISVTEKVVGDWTESYADEKFYHWAIVSKEIGEPVLLLRPEQAWEGRSAAQTGRRWNEGSYLMRHNGKYVMTYSANFYAGPDYAVGYATADHPLGPYVKAAENGDTLAQFELGKNYSGFKIPIKDLRTVGRAIAKAATEPGPPNNQSENPDKNPTHGWYASVKYTVLPPALGIDEPNSAKQSPPNKDMTPPKIHARRAKP